MIAIGAVAILTSSVTVAHAKTPELDIPAQPLSRAIAVLGRQAAIEILLNAPGEERRRTHTVKGRFPVGDALSRMLDGLGLSVRSVAPGVYVIVKAPRSTSKQVRPSLPTPSDTVEILVAARRRPERDLDVPLLVNHFEQARLEQGTVRTLADLARFTPGFVATGQTSSATPLLVMRGQRRSISDENRLPLVIYQDEVPLPNQATLSPLFDVASVEILRGPQGTLFGRNATSGAVLLKSVQPGSGVNSYIESEIGNYGQTRLEGAVEVPIAHSLKFRVSGQRARRDGYTRLRSGERTDTIHSDALRAVLRFEPDGLLRSTTTFDMLNADEMGAALILTGVYGGGSVRNDQNAPYFDCGRGPCDIDDYLDLQKSLGRRTSQSSIAPRFQRHFRGISNVTEYGDSDFLVRNIVGLRSTRMDYALDGDGTPLPIYDSVSTSELRQWTEELQVQGRAGTARYIAGAFYLDSAPDGPVVQTISRLIRPDNPESHAVSYQTFRSAAVFGQITIPVAGQTTADLGLRYTGEWTSGCALRSATATPLSKIECLLEGGTSAHAQSGRLTWTAALTHKMGDHSVYLTSRRAFRSGGYNTPTLSGTLAPYQTFKPETLTDFELGAKGRLSIGGIVGSYAIAGYIGLYGDVQRALFPDIDFDGDDDLATDPLTLYINSAEARILGLDGDVSLNLTRGTHLTLSGSWIDARYTQINAPAELTALLGNDPLRNRFTYAPSFSGSFTLSHDITLPGRLGDIGLSADYSYVSSVRLTERPTERFARQPAYGLLGASITWRRPGGLPIDLAIWGRNLTDRFYASGGGTLNPAFTAATIIPGPPRTVGLRIRYSF